ncbi:MAG TPA: D-aminoacyl-tRNA deacylase [Nitriliruptorales bacterium]
MRALVQRVSRAQVTVDDEVVGRIGAGLCVFVGVTHEDTPEQADRLADKVWHLRMLPDDDGVPNRSAAETGAPLLVVAQFTLYADTRKGRRPSYLDAARPEQAQPLIDRVVQRLTQLGATVATGRFQAHMHVSLTNDGPFTLQIEV